MAIDANLLLQGRPTNIQQAIQGGLQTAQQIRQAPIQEALMRQQGQLGQQQLQQNQQALQGNQRTVTAQKGLHINQLASSLANLPLSERAGALARAMPQLQQMGIDPRRIADQDLTDEGLRQVIAATAPFAQQAQQGNRFQFGASRVVEQDGELFFATDKRDPQTGQIETVLSAVPGELADQLGRTTQDRIGEKVETQKEVGGVEQEQKISTAEALARIENKKKRDQAFTDNEIARIDSTIETGLQAAGGLPRVKKGLELLDKIETGGLTALSDTVTDFFGTTSGDKGVLKNILAQNVLEGLQAFKGAISDPERQFIERMETGMARGTEFNIKQLERMKNIYEREIGHAITAAEIAGDDFALQRLQGALEGGEQAPESNQQSLSRQKALEIIPSDMSLGKQLPDGRWEVYNAAGNLIGHVEP